MALYCAMKEITQPIFDGTYSITTAGGYKYMYLKSSGTLTIVDKAEYDLFCVGGGGASGYRSANSYHFSGSGGGGYTSTTLSKTISSGSYVVTIGSGATAPTIKTDTPVQGGATSIGSLCSATGGVSGYNESAGKGGSGGGAAAYCEDSETEDWVAGKSGGSNGSAGGSNTGNTGGAGQGTTTRAFGETSGTLYAGGGGGAGTAPWNYTDHRGGLGGEGGGGNGTYSNSTSYSATSGTANTGGGAGGHASGQGTQSASSKVGGSGLAIIRWKVA